ncbi:MAG: transposase [Clostridia bacterium]|nr:transposase [Clostridia bacterium]
MYKTETHLHTAETSDCGHIKAKDMVELYHEAGYKTLFITDHLISWFFDGLKNMSWEEKVERFMSGYTEAKKAGDSLGMNVILSAEYRFKDCPNDYLVYGIDRDFLLKFPDVTNMTPGEFYNATRDDNIFIVQAHPCRDHVCYPTPEFVDAIEAVNTNPRHDNFTDESYEIAQKHNLPVTGGSDSHVFDDVALCAVVTEHEIKTASDYIELLKENKLTIFENKK